MSNRMYAPSYACPPPALVPALLCPPPLKEISRAAHDADECKGNKSNEVNCGADTPLDVNTDGLQQEEGNEFVN